MADMADAPASSERAPRTPEEVVAQLEEQVRRTPTTRVLQRAMLRYNLGLAYIDLPSGSRDLNLTRAVSSLQEATKLFSRATRPAEHARTQNALGIALRELRRYEEAAQAFHTASQLIPPQANPGEYGAAINNLGLVLADLGRLEEAVEPFTKALEAFRGPGFVQQRILALLHLGQVLTNARDPGRLEEGLARFEEALELADPQEYPYQWALIQHSTGVAYTSIDRPVEAAEAFGQALRVYTRTRWPFQYSLAKNNLGLAYAQLGGVTNLRRAVVAYEGALRMLDLRVHREQWEQVYRNLGLAEEALAGLGVGGTRPQHFARLAGEMEGDELRAFMRERLSEYTTYPDPRRVEALAELDEATLELPDDEARKVTAAWLHVLMELPHEQFLAGLQARMSVHNALDAGARTRASELLERSISEELLAPQRVRVRDTLYEMGYERPAAEEG